jgi:hypothetical protein
MGELRRECGRIFRHWAIAVVAVTVVTAIGGAAFVPSADASFWERIATAAVGAAVGLAAVAVVVLAVALIRVPLHEYRRRHRQQRLGQECVDCGRAVVHCFSVLGLEIKEGAALSGEEVSPEVRTKAVQALQGLDRTQAGQLQHRYERECAHRVYRCATDLYESDHIGREERDDFRSVPVTRSDTPEGREQTSYEMLQVAERLLHFGVRLGGKF